MKKSKKSSFKKRLFLLVLSVILLFVFVALIAGTAYMEKMLNLINKNPDDSMISQEEYEDYINNQTEDADPDFTGETLDPDDVHWDINEETVPDDAHIINIMLIGQDRRPGEGRARSDVMLLCTINTETKKLTMTSFMRDLYVPIPGYRDNRMNATYAFGGMKLLNKCMESNFGIHIDGNVEVDFNGFVSVIDAIGGVDMYLTAAEANHLVKYGHSASVGMNHLDGEAALTHARNRSVGNSDFSRTERQRKVIAAVLEKCKGMSLGQLTGLAEKMLPKVTTDLTNKQILNYIVDILPLLTNLEVGTQQIPASGTFQYARIRGMSVLVPDLEANRQVLMGIIGNS